MLILSKKYLLKKTLQTTLNHLSFLANSLEPTGRISAEIINENTNLIAGITQELVYNNALFYKGVRIISKLPANTLAITGLLESLYLIIKQYDASQTNKIKTNICNLEQILFKLKYSWFPVKCLEQELITAIDLLEERCLPLDQLKVKENPLLINITSLNNSFYYAHYLPQRNYINIYSIRKSSLLQGLFFHEIGHLLILSSIGDINKLPRDYLKIKKLNANLSSMIIEEFCDNFSLYILGKQLSPFLKNFFKEFIKKTDESRFIND